MRTLRRIGNPTPIQSEPKCNEFPIAVRKGNIESPVHRLGQVDEIYVAVP